MLQKETHSLYVFLTTDMWQCMGVQLSINLPYGMHAFLLQSCAGIVDDEEKYDEDDPTKNYEVLHLTLCLLVMILW